MIFDVDDMAFEARVLKNPLPVLVDCWAPSCKPCLGMHPVLEGLAAEYNGRLAVAKINIDENNATMRAYGVRSLPTLLLIHQGAVLDKKLGVMSGPQIMDWIDSRLSV
ncbi:thioredoxin family protein [Castellaniella sp.]|uniref:thioredoxin family protein n=1 Tax=Castellaniella sp. TaxID=1955812 RepID=UPI003C73C11E